MGVLALMNLAAWQLGTWVDKLLGPRGADTESVAPIVNVAIGFLALSTLTLGLASCRLLLPGVFLVALGIPSAIAAARIIRLAGAREKTWTFLKGGFVGSRWLWLLFAAVLVAPLLGAFGPFLGWDALTYHLAIPQRYLDANRIVLSPFSIYDAFPLGTEMLYLVGLALDGPTVAMLLHAEFGALLVVAVFRIAALRSRLASIAAAVVLLADPLMNFEMSVAYNDLEIALFALLAVASLADWVNSDGKEPPLRAALLAAACASIRYPGVIVPVVLAVLTIAGRQSARARLLAVSTFGVATGIVMLPWLARNLIMTGNPVAPALQGLFYASGKEFFSTVAVRQTLAFSQQIGMGRGLAALFLFPLRLTFATVPGRYANSFGFQIGCLYLVGLAIVLLSPAVRRDRLSRLSIWTALLLTLAWFYGSQEARFLLPVFPLVALAAGIGLGDLFDAAPGTASTIREASRGILATIALAGIAYAAWPGWKQLGFSYACALGNQDPELTRQNPILADGRKLREQLPAHARLLPVFESRSFALRGIDQIPWVPLEAPPALQLVHRAVTAQELRCRLDGLGVTHVLVNLTNLKYFRPMSVDGYNSEDFRRDVLKIQTLVATYARPLNVAGLSSGLIVAELLPAPEDCGGKERHGASD
jgi:hypothetical protein